MSTFFITIPRLSLMLCGFNPFRFFVLLFEFWSVLFFSSLNVHSFSLVLSLSNNGTLFTLRVKNKYDIAVLKEIFIFKEYEWTDIENPKIIIDLGAHIGDTALYYHTMYTDAKIYAVEPDPLLFERLCENTRQFPEIIPVHGAISDVSGFAKLSISNRSSLRGSLSTRSDNDTFVEVPTLTLSEMYAKYGIKRADLLKFDIEGAEKTMFGEKDAMEYADAYIGELHCDLADIDPETFIASFVGFAVDMKPMHRNNRFSIKAKKQIL